MTGPGNVVVVNDTAYVNGGAAKVAIASSIGLAKSGWDVFFFSAVGPGDPGLSQWQAMLKLLDDLDPDNTVVHIHLWAKALSSSVVSAAIDRKFRVVVTLHDYL